jgi:hypothetical protein
MSSRQEEKERQRQERLAREQAEQRTAARNRRLRLAGLGAALLALLVVVVVVATTGGGSTKTTTPIPQSALLASTARETSGRTVDGIQCQTNEQAIFHIHAHLTVLVAGRQRIIPQGIGIATPREEQQTADGPFVTSGSCFYWLHSHTNDGIIHIESPIQRTFTLGNYFDIWNQPLSSTQVGPAQGAVTAFVDGRKFNANPRTIHLAAHTLVQLDVGTRIAPAPFTFPPGL